MDELQIKKATALARCTFPVGSNQKRFANTMAGIARVHPDIVITDKQAGYLDLLFHQYRRQIPNSHRKYCNCPDAQAARIQKELLAEARHE